MPPASRTDSLLVSAVIAARDAEDTLRQAVVSLLRQEVEGLEVIVVDDGSRDSTPTVLSALADERLVVLTNDEPLGLAASLNRGLDRARGRYVARLDADDVALPGRLALQLERMRRGDVAVVGSSVLEIDRLGAPGALHRPPLGSTAVAWAALFGAPFFHPTALIDRRVLDEHGLRYDPRFEQAQDYDLWARLLEVASGDNLPEVLVLRRVHGGQTTRRRGEGQRSFVREIALRRLAAQSPDLSDEEAELAWLVGTGAPVGASAEIAVAAYLRVRERFAAGRSGRALRPVDVVASRAVLRAALSAPPGSRSALVRRALEVDPLLPVRLGRDRLGRRREAAGARNVAVAALVDLERDLPDPAAAQATGGTPVRVTVVLPEPTPYRTPLLDRLARRPELALSVVYAARTVADRTWETTVDHPAVFLKGVRVPGVRRVVHHDYTLTPGVLPALRAADPEVVVVNGWSTFTAQAALAWSRVSGIPYVLLVSSHDAASRPTWRRAIRAPIVPRLVRGAAGAFALGTLSREALVAAGAPPQRVRVFANTIDVAAWSARAEELRDRRPALRETLGLDPADVAVLCVGRLSPEKSLDTLIHAVAQAAEPSLALVLAGDGPERERLATLAGELGVRLVLLGDVAHERLPEIYVAADLFALVSAWERWGVVVNEAAACGLPLVLSDQVGAAPDLLVDGENGALVAAGDVVATADALARYARDPELRRAHGERSTAIAAAWGYEPSVESFVALVREVAGR